MKELLHRIADHVIRRGRGGDGEWAVSYRDEPYMELIAEVADWPGLPAMGGAPGAPASRVITVGYVKEVSGDIVGDPLLHVRITGDDIDIKVQTWMGTIPDDGIYSAQLLCEIWDRHFRTREPVPQASGNWMRDGF